MIAYYKRVPTCLLSTVLSFRLLGGRLRIVIGSLQKSVTAHFMVFQKFTYISSRLWLSHFCSRICDALSRSLKWFVYFMPHNLCHIGCDFEFNLKLKIWSQIWKIRKITIFRNFVIGSNQARNWFRRRWLGSHYCHKYYRVEVLVKK